MDRGWFGRHLSLLLWRDSLGLTKTFKTSFLKCQFFSLVYLGLTSSSFAAKEWQFCKRWHRAIGKITSTHFCMLMLTFIYFLRLI
ncbi:hypothetical protein SAMN05444149_1048 [Pseudosulfitobacter pseudonitzschiae]|nr:hypothetical protein SAMN05444149_1048 [Pseudosulfitobacter pseudonitzschiae]